MALYYAYFADCHVGAVCTACEDHFISGIAIYQDCIPKDSMLTATQTVASAVDADGDLVVPRRHAQPPRATLSLCVHHALATEISEVGSQLWSAAFLLSDFVLAQPDLFISRVCLELGAGLGALCACRGRGVRLRLIVRM